MDACKDYRGMLDELETGPQGPRPSGRLTAHLGECAACRKELAENKYLIDLARLVYGGEAQLPQMARTRIAMAAAEGALERPWWRGWQITPLRPVLTAVAGIAVLLVGLVLQLDRRTPLPARDDVRLEMQVEGGGKVRLAWTDGRQGTYKVRKSASPQGLGRAEAHTVRGNNWVDEEADSSRVVFYQVD